LIVLGGLGFPVLKNLWDHWTAWFQRTRRRPVRLTTHTKLVLVTTGCLIVGGALLVVLTELPSEPRTGEASRWIVALFASITSRTAGFNTIPTEALLTPTVVLLLFLMFVGGSPASTAGGIKTTTLAVSILNTIRTLRDPTRDLVAFRRRISGSVANRAFAVLILALGWVTTSTLILTALMPHHPPLDLAFEAVSAFSTVGLSRGITADLPVFGKLVIIASMLVGRIGILYVALGVLHKERPGRIAYPEGNVIIS
jgi:trk system potassium uptake protein TrkH